MVERMGTLPLDLDDLLGALARPGRGVVRRAAGRHDDGSRPPSRRGRRRDRRASIATLLGFDLMAQLGPQAAFLSAGGYHHHLGGNTWESRGAAQAPEGTARLRSLHDRAAGRRVARRGRGSDRRQPSRRTRPGTACCSLLRLSAAGSGRACTTTRVFVGRVSAT